MKKKKIFKLGVAFLSIFTLGSTLVPTATILAATETNEVSTTNKILTKEEAAAKEDGLLFTQDYDLNTPVVGTRQIIADGGWTWKKIGAKNSSTAQDEKFKANVGNFIYKAFVTYFGGKLIKGALTLGEIQGAMTSAFIASVTKPIKQGKTVYYTTTTYEDTDAVNYYVKNNVKAYSDSARKKQVGSYDSIHKFRKK